jgi:hypothetical protein
MRLVAFPDWAQGAFFDDDARPKIVCLCGSTRFWRDFQEASLRETLAGRIVLSIGAARAADDDDRSFGGYVPVGEFDAAKAALDALHLRTVELADEVLCLNAGGYVGPSTEREVKHAIALGKPVRWLEPDRPPAWALMAVEVRS